MTTLRDKLSLRNTSPKVSAYRRLREASSLDNLIAIQDDAGDPHFLANLNRLGPVRVDRHAQTVHLVRIISIS